MYFYLQETSLNFPVRNISKTEFLLQDNEINNWLYRNFFFPPSHGASAPPSQPSESKYRIQSEGNMLAENAENRRHQAGSDVGKGHLDADDSLA